MITTLDPARVIFSRKRNTIEVIFPEVATGSGPLSFAGTWVKDGLSATAGTFHAAGSIIEALEADLTTIIEEAGSHGVHVEPVLIELRGLLRASRVSLRARFLAGGQEIVPQAAKIHHEEHCGFDAKAEEDESDTDSSEKLLLLGQMGLPCLTSSSFEEALQDFITLKVFRSDVQGLLGALSVELSEFRRKRLARIVQASFVDSFGERCQKVFDQYIQYAEINGGPKWRAATSQAADRQTTDAQKVSEIQFPLVVDLLSFLALSESAAEDLVQEVNCLKLRDWFRRDGPDQIPYTLHEGLQDHIERFVLRSPVCVVSIARDLAAERRSLESARGRLVSEHGFCSHCADALIEEFASREDFLRS